MTWVAACLFALATWLLVPDRPLRRLEVRAPSSVRLAAPAEDSYPLPYRVGMGVGAAVVLWLVVPALWWIAPFVGLAAGFASQWLRKPRDDTGTARELAQALEFLAVGLEAGAPVQAAVATTAAVSPFRTARLLRRVLAHLDVGRPPEEAWGELITHPVWGAPARELVRSARSGTSLVASLRRQADDARIQARELATKRARTVGVKSVVPLMTCFLPAFVLIAVVPIIASLLGSLLE